MISYANAESLETEKSKYTLSQYTPLYRPIWRNGLLGGCKQIPTKRPGQNSRLSLTRRKRRVGPLVQALSWTISYCMQSMHLFKLDASGHYDAHRTLSSYIRFYASGMWGSHTQLISLSTIKVASANIACRKPVTERPKFAHVLLW